MMHMVRLGHTNSSKLLYDSTLGELVFTADEAIDANEFGSKELFISCWLLLGSRECLYLSGFTKLYMN